MPLTIYDKAKVDDLLADKLGAKIVNAMTSSVAASLSDCNNIILLAGGGTSFALTINNDTTTAYPNGSEITIISDNTATGYTISGNTGVIINNSASVNVMAYVSKLVKTSSNTWYYA